MCLGSFTPTWLQRLLSHASHKWSMTVLWMTCHTFKLSFLRQQTRDTSIQKAKATSDSKATGAKVFEGG
jgi:hypothetical protein